MKIITYGILLILLFIGLLACKDDLPKPTQNGADTFGCKANGKSWVPNGIPGPGAIPAVNGGFQGRPKYSISIRAYKRGDNIKENISIYLTNVIKTGTYSLNYDTGYSPQSVTPENHAMYSSYDPNTFYGTTAKIGGSVTITRADTVAKIVSGTFSFNAVDNNGKTIKITQGRFDVKP